MNEVAAMLQAKRFAVHDGPGVRTTFFLKGCPLKCRWCHNPESISPHPQMAYYAHKCLNCGECVAVCPAGAHAFREGVHQFAMASCRNCGACEPVCLGGAMQFYGRPMAVDEAMRIALEDRSFYETSGGGVTLSGGEPLLQWKFCVAFLSELKRAGIHTALDSCGLVSREALEAVMPLTELFLIDFKHPDPEEHRKWTGRSNELICENLRFLSEQRARIEIRIPLVPGCNDSEEILKATGRFLGSLRIECVKLLPYHDLARSKYRALGMPDTMPEAESPDDATLEQAAELLRGFGLNARSGRE